MKKTILFGTLSALLFIQCGKDNDLFLIKEGAIGSLNKEVRMKQIDSIFAQDSIVRLNPIPDALGTQGEVEIYEKGGAKLLLLSPFNESNPESVISYIQIFDDRYTTEKGLTQASNFKFVKDNYTIADIETLINAVVIFLEDSDIYLTIDKKSLPESLRYNPSISIEASQIPDDATFKSFMIGWDND